MTIEEQLKAAILLKYKSIRAFTTVNDIPYSTLDSALKRGISNAGIVTMLKVFTALDLDIESIQTGTLRNRQASNFEKEELDPGLQKVIECYNNMDAEGRNRLVEQAEFLSSKYEKANMKEAAM